MGVTQWWRGGAGGGFAGNHVVWAAEPTRSDAAPPADDSHLADMCRTTADALKPRLGDDCTLIVRSPYVLAGDLTEKQLVEWHEATIAPASRAMAQQYFKAAPSEPITILLFSGEESYRRYAKHLFNDEGVTIYGYYRSEKRTLVMNIATGGGTLVHELTHALIDFDFPKVPDWFNEGLASLYEQCRFRENGVGIEGLPNWRLPALQEAIRRERLRPLEDLIAADDFRGAEVGLNYAEARYFCLYLQDRGKLEDFYRRFKADHATDPHGSAAALAVSGAADWKSLNREYREFVLSLKF